MENLKIGFSKSSKKFAPFSWLIMASEKTPYSHVYVKFWSNSLNRWIIYQASHSAVNFMGEALFNSEEIIIEEFSFTVAKPVRDNMMNFCMDNVGRPYGKLSALGLAWVQIASYLGYSVHNPFREVGKTFVCSQLVATLLANSGVKLPVELDDMTPQDLYPIIKGLPSSIIQDLEANV